MIADWNEKLAQMEFILKEEECKRIDAEEKYAILEQEMISQSTEMEEKMAEMERTYMYRLLEQVHPQITPPHIPIPNASQDPHISIAPTFKMLKPSTCLVCMFLFLFVSLFLVNSRINNPTP